MEWIDKDKELPELGRMVLFGFESFGHKDYDVDIYNGIKGIYVIGDNGHIVSVFKYWKVWIYIDDFVV